MEEEVKQLISQCTTDAVACAETGWSTLEMAHLIDSLAEKLSVVCNKLDIEYEMEVPSLYAHPKDGGYLLERVTDVWRPPQKRS